LIVQTSFIVKRKRRTQLGSHIQLLFYFKLSTGKLLILVLQNLKTSCISLAQSEDSGFL